MLIDDKQRIIEEERREKEASRRRKAGRKFCLGKGCKDTTAWFVFLSGLVICWALIFTSIFVFLDYFGRFIGGFYPDSSKGFLPLRIIYRRHILSDYYDPVVMAQNLNWRVRRDFCDDSDLKPKVVIPYDQYPDGCWQTPPPLGTRTAKKESDHDYFLLLEAVHWMFVEFCQILMASFVFYYELREFCRGRRRHWIERLIVQFIRSVVYMFFALVLWGELRLGPTLLGDAKNPRCKILNDKWECERSDSEKNINQAFKWTMVGLGCYALFLAVFVHIPLVFKWKNKEPTDQGVSQWGMFWFKGRLEQYTGPLDVNPQDYLGGGEEAAAEDADGKPAEKQQTIAEWIMGTGAAPAEQDAEAEADNRLQPASARRPSMSDWSARQSQRDSAVHSENTSMASW